MNTLKFILDLIGYGSTICLVAILIAGIVAWAKGILPVLLRLGNGLARRKIAIFAKSGHLSSLRSLLIDSGLFSQDNILDISTKNDFGRAEEATLFLVFWHDWATEIDSILSYKKDKIALIVYAPQDLGFVPNGVVKKLNERRNVVLNNFRGRLLNDIVASIITTSYEK